LPIIKLRRIRWAVNVALIIVMRNPLIISIGKPRGNRSLGSPRRRREDTIKVNVKELVWHRIEINEKLF
jgi:hypothetical protein